jgi:hypothetical protein
MIIRVLTAAKGLPLPQLVVPHSSQPSGITVQNSNHFGTYPTLTVHTPSLYPTFTQLGLKQSGVYNESRILQYNSGGVRPLPRSGLFDVCTWVRRELAIAEEAPNSSETI